MIERERKNGWTKGSTDVNWIAGFNGRRKDGKLFSVCSPYSMLLFVAGIVVVFFFFFFLFISSHLGADDREALSPSSCAVRCCSCAQRTAAHSCGEKREAELRFSLLAVPATATPLCSVGYPACTLLALPFVVSLFFLVGCFILKSDFLSPEPEHSADSRQQRSGGQPCALLFPFRFESRKQGQGQGSNSSKSFSFFDFRDVDCDC